ncbi:hypothetical protein ACFYWH_11405 [Streptomyces sp. NPDC003737]|uniref:hypothetical protein n=1 Tax=Streptomyces sp. NPDC003737 TaxID=3364685 RepID=UPI0036A97A6B
MPSTSRTSCGARRYRSASGPSSTAIESAERSRSRAWSVNLASLRGSLDGSGRTSGSPGASIVSYATSEGSMMYTGRLSSQHRHSTRSISEAALSRVSVARATVYSSAHLAARRKSPSPAV